MRNRELPIATSGCIRQLQCTHCQHDGVQACKLVEAVTVLRQEEGIVTTAVRPNSNSLHELALHGHACKVDISRLESAEYVESLPECPAPLGVVDYRARYAEIAGSAASAAKCLKSNFPNASPAAPTALADTALLLIAPYAAAAGDALTGDTAASDSSGRGSAAYAAAAGEAGVLSKTPEAV
jgi:hypothetical protein